MYDDLDEFGLLDARTAGGVSPAPTKATITYRDIGPLSSGEFVAPYFATCIVDIRSNSKEVELFFKDDKGFVTATSLVKSTTSLLCAPIPLDASSISVKGDVTKIIFQIGM